MQKKLAFVMLCTLCAVAGFGQSAVFTEPKANATLYIGSWWTFTWTSSGSASVKLVLVSKNDGMQWNLKSGLVINAGSWSWMVGSLENGKTVPAGANYLVRMQNMADGSIIAKTGLFSIAAAPAPLAVAKGKMNRPAETFSGLHPQFKEMALALTPPPAGTTFEVKEIVYDFESEGKLGLVKVLISVNSPKDFVISPNYGDREYGAQFIKYDIEMPYQGGTACGQTPHCSEWISVKGGGISRPFFNYPAAILPAGQRLYTLAFKPECPGLVKGIGLFQKMPGGFFEPGGLCRREYYPRLHIMFFACTATGKVTSYAKTYLIYDKNAWPLCWVQLPGETNYCAGGIQYW